MTHDLLQWERSLRASGHRITRQRTLILDAVCAGEGHTSFGEIYARVRRADRSIDQSTVYRALHLFIDLGIVVSADTGSDENYYEVAKPKPHHHLVCRRCGGEQEVDNNVLQPMIDEVYQQHGFQVATDHLVIFGLCADCLADEEREQSN